MRPEKHEVMTPARAARLQHLIETMPSFAELPRVKPPGRPAKPRPPRRRTIVLARIKVRPLPPRKPRTIVLARIHVAPRRPRTVRLTVLKPRRRRGRPPGPPKPPRAVYVPPASKYNLPEKPFPGFPLTAHASGQWRKKIAGRHVCFGSWRDRHVTTWRHPRAGRTAGPLDQVDPNGVMWRRAFNAFQNWRARPA